ncbi:MAG: tRNA lysidine(34) synthetase TilS [Woeseiaceae bacterium]|nr:tRNA lysidine(34) synthetase TilS [Woeseiaceae bacterium]
MRIAADFGVESASIAVRVDANGRQGIEAAARDARYATLASQARAGDWILTAQHRDDQAETLLLNLLRGSGPLGLAAMPAVRDLGEAKLLRPLLDVGRSELERYAETRALSWLDDPGNEDLRFDRNFLRRRIVPLLQSRWASVGERVAQSAALAAETQQLLEDLARTDLIQLGADSPLRLPLSGLRALEPSRRNNLLRYACRVAGLAQPPRGRLESIATDLLDAAADRAPLVRWSGAEIRRYRDDVFVLRETGPLPAEARLAVGKGVELGPDLGRLEFESTGASGIRDDLAVRGLDIRFRRGGEKLRPSPGGSRRALKNLFQEEGILPWMRERIPLLMDGDRLVAVGDLWVDAECVDAGGYRVAWRDRPPLR